MHKVEASLNASGESDDELPVHTEEDPNLLRIEETVAPWVPVEAAEKLKDEAAATDIVLLGYISPSSDVV